MLKQVPTVRTSFTKTDFIKSTVLVWKQLYNIFPLKNSIGVLYAQWSLETGQGLDCWNWNIGNVKAVDVKNETIEYCVLDGVKEVVNGKTITLLPTDPGSWFRSFNSLTDGINFLFNFLRTDRYSPSWVAVENGDYEQFAELLSKEGYYTAPVSQYAAGLKKYFDQFMADDVFDNIVKELQAPISSPQPPPENPIPVISPPIQQNTPTPIVAQPTKSFNLFNFLFDLIKLFFSKFK